MKTIIVRLKKAGNRTTTFSISDAMGNILIEDVTKQSLIDGIALTIEDNVTAITITPTGKKCCEGSFTFPITTITNQELVDWEYTSTNTATLWKHLTDTTIYNNFYGCVNPYIIEYPFAYQFQDQIIQNVQDYTKVYTYLPSILGSFNTNRKVQVDDKYFNKAVIYNDQDSSGILELNPKPANNLKLYMSYPIYNTDSKSIMYTKSDNFYQFNTFWNIVKNKLVPLFTSSCESMSFDKEVNQDNMNYGIQSFKKATIRGKDTKVRLILDNDSSIHLVSQLFVTPSQISYK